MSQAVEMSTCPICNRLVKTRRMKNLYEMPVCRKCRNGFANRRQFGYAIDIICLYIVTQLIMVGIFLITPDLERTATSPHPAAILGWVFWGWVVGPLIFTMKDGFNGQSPGKWLFGVRVVDKDTMEPISFGRSLKRNLITLIPITPLILSSQLLKGNRWGDGWAKTRVIWNKHAYKPPFDIRGLLCTHCGYNLTGNVSGRCPECGNDIPQARAVNPFAFTTA